MAEFEVGHSVRVRGVSASGVAHGGIGVIADYNTQTPGLHRRFTVELPGATVVYAAWHEIERARPFPPPLEFETPPCSICGTTTEYEDGEFRCPECLCSWPRKTAHLHEGQWDDREAEQCPDVLTAQETGEQPGSADYRCMRSSGHEGDHIHPEAGEWTDHEDGAPC